MTAAFTLSRRKMFSNVCVTEVVLHPVVTFETPVDAETLAQLHEAAHRGCFIANSVRTTVRVEA